MKSQVLRNEGANQWLGKLGEELANKFLMSKGYRTIDRNWRCRYGEIDLVIEKSGVTVFVEVKLRSNNKYGQPEDAIDFFKRSRFLKAIKIYISKNQTDNFQVDVVLIDLNPVRKLAHMRHIENVELI